MYTVKNYKKDQIASNSFLREAVFKTLTAIAIKHAILHCVMYVSILRSDERRQVGQNLVVSYMGTLDLSLCHFN